MKYLLLALPIFIFSCKNEPTTINSPALTEQANTKETDPRILINNDYLIDDQHSYIGFKIKYFGYSPVRGRFNEFDGTMFYDPENMNSLSVRIFIDANSINTGNERRDNDLKGEGTWFDAANFPNMEFISQKVIVKIDGSFDLIGDLTIKEVTKTDTISFNKPTALSKDWAGNDQVDFSGRLTINRQDFGVFGGDFWSSVMENGVTQLSDEVEIDLDIHCRKPDYQVRYQDTDSSDLNKLLLDNIKAYGIDQGLLAIDSLFMSESISAGKLSSIGYTLLEWENYDKAKRIFNKRLELYPDKTSTWIQLGITELLLNKKEEAKIHFQKAIDLNPTNSRAYEYLRLIEKL